MRESSASCHEDEEGERGEHGGTVIKMHGLGCGIPCTRGEKKKGPSHRAT